MTSTEWQNTLVLDEMEVIDDPTPDLKALVGEMSGCKERPQMALEKLLPIVLLREDQIFFQALLR